MGRSCSIPDCSKPHHGHGYCQGHHRRLLLHGDPLFDPFSEAELERKFWNLVAISPDLSKCWLWLGSRKGKKYGSFYMRIGGKLERNAHRIAYYLHYKVEPADLHVRHRCDNPPCCNPGHLLGGTNAENMADKIGKPSGVQGSNHPLAKLDENKVRIIKSEISKGTQLKKLAVEFGVSPSLLTRISKDKSWKHVSIPA